MGNVTLDLDQLEADKDRSMFKLFGETYTIPVVGYGKALQLEDLGKKIKKSAEEKKVKDTVDSILSVILLIIPDLAPKKEEMETSLSFDQLNALSNLIFDEIRKRSKDEGLNLEEDQKELLYYRKKNGDEFRKGQDQKKGSKRTKAKKSG